MQGYLLDISQVCVITLPLKNFEISSLDHNPLQYFFFQAHYNVHPEQVPLIYVQYA